MVEVALKEFHICLTRSEGVVDAVQGNLVGARTYAADVDSTTKSMVSFAGNRRTNALFNFTICLMVASPSLMRFVPLRR